MTRKRESSSGRRQRSRRIREELQRDTCGKPGAEIGRKYLIGVRADPGCARPIDIDPLALIKPGKAHQPYSVMTPRHELEADGANRRHEARRYRGLRPIWKYLDGWRNRTKECFEPFGKLLRPLARLNPPHALDREAVPVCGGYLVARMKVAHIAQESGERDRIAHPLLGERTRLLRRARWRSRPANVQRLGLSRPRE